MDTPLKDLIARYAQPGRVDWIGLRPERYAPVVPVERVHLSERGLEGDHGASLRRAVTMIQAEHLSVIGSFLGRMSVAATGLRRNLVVSGLNLAALKGRAVRVGDRAVLEITGVCAPCSRMEKALGPGGYSAMRGHGGWCARVLTPGEICVGAEVEPLTTGVPRSL